MSADLFAAFMQDEQELEPRGTNQSTNRTRFNGSNNGRPTQSAAQVWSPSKLNAAPDRGSSLWKKDVHGGEVLFDAEDAGSETDFGAFEAPAEEDSVDHQESLPQLNEQDNRTVVGRHAGHSAVLPDLLDIDYHDPQPYTSTRDLAPVEEQARSVVANHRDDKKIDGAWKDDWGAFEQTQPLGEPRADLRDPVEGEKGQNADPAEDEWEPFEDGQPGPDKTLSTPGSLSITGQGSQTGKSSSASSTTVSERPTNIPPPSSLLQLLSSVFDSLSTSHTTNQVPKSQLADKVLVVFRTASRLVAGRTLRWKRDTILAQSMRIGQAGKTGGMKLASVNRSESAKEERDAEEMIRDWSKHVHEFNSIIAQAERPPQRMKISTSTSLKILKYMSHPETLKQCVLCGLRRTERLVDVDVDFDDLFGEFWVEHWGHRDCSEFWSSYKAMLGQR